jgi:sec-independent protein translocase protein TatB
VAKDLKTATSAKSMGLDAVKDAASKFEKWDPLKPQARPAVPTPAAMTPIVPLSEAPNVALGPATKALAEKQIERRIQSNAKVDALRAAAAGSKAAPAADVPVAAAPVRGGRVRSKAAAAAEASPVTKAAVKPAVKPAIAKPAATKTTAAKPKSPKADA